MCGKEIIERSTILVTLAVALGFIVGHRCDRSGPVAQVEARVDTLFVRDTIKVTDPVFLTRRIVDTIAYPVHDTTKVRDTLYVYLAREQVTWEDSLSRVYASGIDPQVDSVIHFVQDRIITKEIPVIQVKRTRWGIGVQAGVTGDKNGVIPYVGVGVSYNIIGF